jgi:hypothetical protein
MSEHRTAATGSGFSHGGATWARMRAIRQRRPNESDTAYWERMERDDPTPTPDAGGNWPTPVARDEKGADLQNRLGPPSLGHLGSTWPTPRAMTGGPESAERKKELGRTNSGGGDLQAAAISWPTPRASLSGSRAPGTGGRVLSEEAQQFAFDTREVSWPTPKAGDSKASGSRNAEGSSANLGVSLTDAIRTGDSSGRRDRSTERPGDESTPTLNPLFVEWLMGVPRGWTSATVSGCSATELSRWLRLMRSELSRIEQG